MAKQLARELINAGVHFGHGVSRWNPKMAPFIFAKRGNIHVIDVKETLKGILIAKKLLAEIVATGGDVVFVGTKRQAQKAVEASANRCGMHFVSERWLGGMLTNFRTIRSRLQRLEQLEAMVQDGTMESESKKQASRFKREMRKISTNLDGVRKMTRLPGGRRGRGRQERVSGPARGAEAQHPDGRRPGHGFRSGYGGCRDSGQRRLDSGRRDHPQ